MNPEICFTFFGKCVETHLEVLTKKERFGSIVRTLHFLKMVNVACVNACDVLFTQLLQGKYGVWDHCEHGPV